MDFKKLMSDALVAFSAQGVRLLLNVLTALFVPKVLGVTDYGYWQFFLLVISYVGICHCGINDGVYLLYGGKNRENINKSEIKSQFIVGLTLEVILAVVGIAYTLYCTRDPQRLFCFALSAIYMILINATYFWGFVFQATDETKIFSYSAIAERVAFLAFICALLLLNVKQFEYYVFATIVSMAIQLICCLLFAKSYLASEVLPLAVALGLVNRSMRIGIKLTIANIASTLILGIGRMVIDYRWGIEAFGKLSFSLSLVTFFLALVSQASMVLFPALKKCSEAELRSFADRLRDFMELVFPLVYILFYPISAVLGYWLPEYESSLLYLPLLLPICVFESKADILCYTVFKALRKESALLQINILTLLISGISAFVMGFVFQSIYGVIASMAISIIIRSCIAEVRVSKLLRLGGSSLWVQELLLTGCFIVSALIIGRGALSFGVYLVIYTLYLYLNRTRAIQLSTALKMKIRSIG